jgi:hypothetical protein
LRRTNRLASEIANNLTILEDGLWQQTMETLDGLRGNQTVGTEREVADFEDDIVR